MIPMLLLSNKDNVNMFFKQAAPTDKMCKCQWGISRTQNDTTFSNLMQLLEKKLLAELWAVHNKSLFGQQQCLDKLVCCPKVNFIYGWVSNATYCLWSTAVAQEKSLQTHIGYKRVSLNTFKLYAFAPASRIMASVLECVQKCFSLDFNEQDTLEAHYVAVFARYPRQHAHKHRSVVSKLSPLEDEATQDFDERVIFLQFVWEAFVKDRRNVAVLVGKIAASIDLSSQNLGFQARACLASVSDGCEGNHRVRGSNNWYCAAAYERAADAIGVSKTTSESSVVPMTVECYRVALYFCYATTLHTAAEAYEKVGWCGDWHPFAQPGS